MDGDYDDGGGYNGVDYDDGGGGGYDPEQESLSQHVLLDLQRLTQLVGGGGGGNDDWSAGVGRDVPPVEVALQAAVAPRRTAAPHIPLDPDYVAHLGQALDGLLAALR